MIQVRMKFICSLKNKIYKASSSSGIVKDHRHTINRYFSTLKACTYDIWHVFVCHEIDGHML
ncbi:hypothetical protein F383_16406 [Gossypium arboreum]|uniref:Uncharacterized protein n=1 Tax=Gossypium arboreum TaxID=29729 RepID=A0A0B0NHU7_GOSAR|nr:hypothetical protein F383_16406 [Gossypium arboreum]